MRTENSCKLRNEERSPLKRVVESTEVENGLPLVPNIRRVLRIGAGGER